MKNPFAKYDGRTYRDIYHILIRDHPGAMAHDLIEQIRAFRRERRSLQATHRVCRELWSDVLAGLNHERKIMRSMNRYKPQTDSPERQAFIDLYTAVLEQTHAVIKHHYYNADSPPKYTHWTDYVDDADKDAVYDATARIPIRAKVKIKIPFERTIPSILHNKKRQKLEYRLDREMETTRRCLDVTPDDPMLLLKMTRMKAAKKILNKLHPTDDLPTTWHRLLGEKENK